MEISSDLESIKTKYKNFIKSINFKINSITIECQQEFKQKDLTKHVSISTYKYFRFWWIILCQIVYKCNQLMITKQFKVIFKFTWVKLLNYIFYTGCPKKNRIIRFSTIFALKSIYMITKLNSNTSIWQNLYNGLLSMLLELSER